MQNGVNNEKEYKVVTEQVVAAPIYYKCMPKSDKISYRVGSSSSCVYKWVSKSAEVTIISNKRYLELCI